MTSVVEYWKAQTREMTRRYNEKEREVEQVVRHFADQSEKLKSKQAIIDGLEFEIEDLQTQSAKLRELLADLAICACGKYCYGCPHQYDGCNRDQRLRELGIEVAGK